MQPRAHFDPKALEELAESIRSRGVLQPILASPAEEGRYFILAGERRWRAAQQAGLETVPVLVRRVEDPRERLELALIENLQRADLDPLEEAEAYRRLAEEFGLTHDEIARRVGKTRTAVTNQLRLLKLAPKVQELLRMGQLTPGQARPLLALPEEETQVALAERAVREGLSARALEALVQQPTARKPTRVPEPPNQEPHAQSAADRLTRVLQTRVEIVRRGKGGTILIYFHSEEELMRLYDLLRELGNRRRQP
jgi:ParB family chromosome partitioning protein